MNPHLERARMLLSQSRYDMAEQELRQALGQEPNSAEAHSALAICLVEREAFKEATEEAEHAIHLAPDSPFVHYVLSLVLLRRNRPLEAEQAIKNALQLDPYDADYFGMLAGISFTRRRWSDALEAAEQGLQIDPEHVDCTNMRARSLVKLGRKDTAQEALLAALRRAPEDADTHANQGWTLVEQGKYQEAMEHFREALRLQPNSEWARQGILEAMKAKYVLYRWVLAYFFWMMKLSGSMRWGVIIAAFIGFQYLAGLMNDKPEWTPWIMPVLIAYIGFALMTWLAAPLFNLALRLNRFGRLVLSRAETMTANGVGICVLAALGCVVFYFAAGNGWSLLGALCCIFVIPPLTAIHVCNPGKPRTLAISLTIFMVLFGLMITVPLMSQSLMKANHVPEQIMILMLLPAALCLKVPLLFPVVVIGSQFAANLLASWRPKR